MAQERSQGQSVPYPDKPASRLASLDMLRGIAVAGMVLVNCPGSWQHQYAPLRHAGWTGCTVADLVFPFFLFAVGAAQACSLAGIAHSGHIPRKRFIKLLRRTTVLFLLGLFLNALPGLLQAGLHGTPFDPGHLRIMGVLQRIALVSFAAAACIVLLPKRLLWPLVALLLLGYWAVLAMFPGGLSPANNPALHVDRLVLGSDHLYRGGTDPEGLFTTLPAMVTVLLGYASGRYARARADARAAAARLLAAGALGLALGLLWSPWLPVCKELWSGSYALVSAGWAAIIFALCHLAGSVSALRRTSMPAQLLGRNALFFFVATAIAARLLLAVTVEASGRWITLWTLAYDRLFASWLGSTSLASLSFAAAWLAAWWLIVLFMDRRGWRIWA